MEDWEQHFADKSRRRAEKDRRRERVRVVERVLIGGAMLAAIALAAWWAH